MKRLYRSRTNRIIGGVCGGIGDYLELDPVFIRLVWGILFFMGGVGFLAYIIAWVIIPEEGEENTANAFTENSVEQTPDQKNHKPQVVIGLFLVILGAILLLRDWWYLDQIFREIVRFSWRYLLPLVLIGFGIFILAKRGQSRRK
ncbi:MAG TPA: PspC domain-containing protein [Candidatus Marinimicrobia bacterium]|nr:PspC domain-containing protein [Candidatus Neomarinimicrobiota bacterium]